MSAALMGATKLVVRFNHQFADTGARVDVDLEVPTDGIVGVFGPSGSGKTTLLRVIAGLLQVPNAQVAMASNWQSADHFVPSHHRKVGYVFQEPSLFPHLTVAGNLRFARRRASRELNDGDKLLKLLGLDAMLDRSVSSLSGGEQQRVAIARALFSTPNLLILDEPLASLDHQRKQEILPYLLRLKRELDIPIVYVSHSAEELACLADWLVIMDQGQVQASGPIQETFLHIAGAAHGESDLAVLIEGTVTSREPEWGLARVEFAGGELLVRDSERAVGDSIRLRIQARDVSISLQQVHESSILNSLPATLSAIEGDVTDSMARVTAWVGETQILANITRRSVAILNLKAGQQVYLQFKSVAILN